MPMTDINLAERSGNLVESHKGYDPRIIFFYFIMAALLLVLVGGLAYQQLGKVMQHAEAERAPLQIGGRREEQRLVRGASKTRLRAAVEEVDARQPTRKGQAEAEPVVELLDGKERPNAGRCRVLPCRRPTRLFAASRPLSRTKKPPTKPKRFAMC
jgi:hypothetical protein